MLRGHFGDRRLVRHRIAQRAACVMKTSILQAPLGPDTMDVVERVPKAPFAESYDPAKLADWNRGAGMRSQVRLRFLNRFAAERPGTGARVSLIASTEWWHGQRPLYVASRSMETGEVRGSIRKN